MKQQRTEKPLLFRDFQLRSEFAELVIQELLLLHALDSFQFNLTGNYRLKGFVKEKVETSAGVLSMNLTITNYKNALFNLTLFTDPVNGQKITGRLIHPQYGDALHIVFENGRYYLEKIEQRLLLVQ